MAWYLISVYIHIMAACLWIGHMIFWVVAAGTITKRFLSAETRGVVLALRDEFGQIGWPSLFVLTATGVFILYHQGTTIEQIISSPSGRLLGGKLILVSLMIVFQSFVGPKRVILGWFNLLVALAIVGTSVWLVR